MSYSLLLCLFQAEQIQSLSLFYPALQLLDLLGGHPSRAFCSILLMSCTGGIKLDMVILDGVSQPLPMLLLHKQSFLKILETPLKPKRSKATQNRYGKENNTQELTQNKEEGYSWVQNYHLENTLFILFM